MTAQVISAWGESQYRALSPYEKLQAANPHWSKNQNWKIAEDMSFEDIENTDLAQFLKEL